MLESEVVFESAQLLYDPTREEGSGALIGVDMEAQTLRGQGCSPKVCRGEELEMKTSGGQLVEARGVQGEGNEWTSETIRTPFGMTDDVVNLHNGKMYYFFKLPHKACSFNFMMYSTHNVYTCIRMCMCRVNSASSTCIAGPWTYMYQCFHQALFRVVLHHYYYFLVFSFDVA